MVWQLNEDISYCQLDGRLLFLDIGTDRYFQLSPELELGFLDYVSGVGTAETDLSALSGHKISQGTTVPERTTAAAMPLPNASVPETTSIAVRPTVTTILNVFVSVAKMQHRLRRQRLKYVLEALVRYRQRHVAASSASHDQTNTDSEILEAAAAFNRVRPYVPITSRCLIDSLSLVEFLAKRNLYASIVIAVACDPFSAHAWAQHGNIVLNDTLGNAQSYMPIRVI